VGEVGASLLNHANPRDKLTSYKCKKVFVCVCVCIYIYICIKVKFTLGHSTKAHRGSRGIALIFL